MRFCSLGSGSEGNALAILLPGTHATTQPRYLLIDCGFAPRELGRRLARAGLTLDGLRGIFITHEHGDHVGGAFRVAARQRCPVYLTHGTRSAVAHRPGFDLSLTHLLQPDTACEFEDLSLLAVPVPHDAREPVQFVVDDGRSRLGVLTDIGHCTAHVHASMQNLQALILETNHDGTMLEAGRYPPSLKRRIRGDWGHLENDQAAAILSRMDTAGLRAIVGAHLSRENNRADLARRALADALGANDSDVLIADQDEGLSWVDI